ncbi:MAG TPA: hypothetical protein VNT28_04530, partial [Candidatus Limnocylindrales bacterium]|nr:hypothetical protein [Candidatus Limnocylindrales bacterium]
MESLGLPAPARHLSSRNAAGSITLAIAATLAFSLVVPMSGWATNQVDVTGVVVFEHGDDFENRREVEYVSLDTGRERFSLQGERAHGLRQGQRVRIRAHRRGGIIHLAASSSVSSVPAREADGLTSHSTSTSVQPSSTSTSAVVNKN